MFRQATAAITIAAFLFSPFRGMSAEQIDHLVPAAELQFQLTIAEQQRQADIEALDNLLRRHESQQLLAKAGLDSQEIRQAIPQLDDETLAELADQSRQAEGDVSGGFFGGLIILLILALILAVVIVKNTDIGD